MSTIDRRRAGNALATSVFLVIAAVSPANAGETPPWQKPSPWPDRIVATLPGDPATSFAVTWRTDDSVGRSLAEIAPATPDARFDLAEKAVEATAEHMDLAEFHTPQGVARYIDNQSLGGVQYNSATFDHLEPDTDYYYRVRGAPGDWSEWFKFRTAPLSGPITFVYTGDAQQGVRTHWARLIREAYHTAPDVRFFLHGGDLVQQGASDRDWAGWFNAGSFIHAQVAQVPVMGNHDHMRVEDPVTGKRGPRVPTPLWRAQFTLPVDDGLPNYFRERVYELRYSKDLSVFVLDSTPSEMNEKGGGYELQAKWLKEHLAASTARWKIVTMHHPYFVPLQLAATEDNSHMQKAFAPVIADGGVDMVLTAHIHFYNRASQPIAAGDGRAMTGKPDAVKTVFVISAASAAAADAVDPAYVSAHSGKVGDGGMRMDRVAENTPMFQVITVDGDTLRYRAHMATGQTYDTFDLVKDGHGILHLRNGKPSYGDTRLFEKNTGRYAEWFDLL